MGSLADIIVAHSSDAQAILDSEYPLGTFPGVNSDGLNPLHIAALHALLTDKDFSQLRGDYQPVAKDSVIGPWLIRLPGELITALANIAPHDQASVAAKWASTDHLREDAWSEQDAENYLAQLIHFSQSAVFEGKEVFLCAYN